MAYVTFCDPWKRQVSVSKVIRHDLWGIWKRSSAIWERIWALPAAMMTPSGLCWKAKTTAWGDMQRCRFEAWKSINFHRNAVMFHQTFVNSVKKQWIRGKHSKMRPQTSTPLSRMRNGVVVSSRECENHGSIGVVAWESMDFQGKVLILHSTFVNFLKK